MNFGEIARGICGGCLGSYWVLLVWGSGLDVWGVGCGANPAVGYACFLAFGWVSHLARQDPRS